MGIGVLWLLQQVHVQKSLRQAASVLGISYSKAFSMIRNLEKSLGVAVLDRRKGGSARDGATLTEFGVRFIERYASFEQDAKQQLQQSYEQFRTQLAELLEAGDDSGGVQ